MTITYLVLLMGTVLFAVLSLIISIKRSGKKRGMKANYRLLIDFNTKEF